MGEQAASSSIPLAPASPSPACSQGLPTLLCYTGWTSSGDLPGPPSASPLAMGWGSNSGHQNNPTLNTQQHQHCNGSAPPKKHLLKDPRLPLHFHGLLHRFSHLRLQDMNSEDESMPVHPHRRNYVCCPQFTAGMGTTCAGLLSIFIQAKLVF